MIEFSPEEIDVFLNRIPKWNQDGTGVYSGRMGEFSAHADSESIFIRSGGETIAIVNGKAVIPRYNHIKQKYDSQRDELRDRLRVFLK